MSEDNFVLFWDMSLVMIIRPHHCQMSFRWGSSLLCYASDHLSRFRFAPHRHVMRVAWICYEHHTTWQWASVAVLRTEQRQIRCCHFHLAVPRFGWLMFSVVYTVHRCCEGLSNCRIKQHKLLSSIINAKYIKCPLNLSWSEHDKRFY